MNDLYYNIIIIVLVIVLFLAYILIAYFYTSYNNYKDDVDDNFEKTKNYINTTVSKIDDNIRSSITENNSKINSTSNYINDIDKKINRVNLKTEDYYFEIKNNLNNYTSNLNNTNLLLSCNQVNLNKFDTNIKQFIQYKSNGTTINDAIYNYQFGATPNLSLDLLRNVNAISGMTIETDNTSNFRLCDKTKNCMDMSINNGGLNIFPTNFSSNTTENILIYDKNKQVLAKFDLKNRGIYLGGEGEDAGMYIQDSNVYVKKINILVEGASYKQNKIIEYNKKIGNPFQLYTNYPIDETDFSKNLLPEIKGIYSIIKGTTENPNNTIIFNFITSRTIPIGNTFKFFVDELLTDINKPDILIASNSIESNFNILSVNIINSKLITIKSSSIIEPYINYRIKIKSSDILIDNKYTETTITNIISAIIDHNFTITN